MISCRTRSSVDNHATRQMQKGSGIIEQKNFMPIEKAKKLGKITVKKGGAKPITKTPNNLDELFTK